MLVNFSLMVKLSCFFILVAFLLSRVGATIDEDALLAFKSAIISDPYQILSRNWSSDASVCSWIGVSCSITGQRVTTLNVSGFGFEGPLVPHLGNLTFLRFLVLTSNNFTGIIPHELSNLRNLRVFDVGFNNLTGDIPSWFGTLTELNSVFLDHNAFSGSIPQSLGNNTKLRILKLSYNFLGGVIPKEIGNLSYLEELDLKYNGQIADSIPDVLFNLSRIEWIDLTGNRLSGRLPNSMCDNVPKLNGLYLSANLLSGQIPINIYKCSNLHNLSLSYNHFNGSIPTSVGLLTNLQTLFLGINSFQGGLPPDLRNLSRLQVLSLTGASLRGQIPTFIFNMSSLERVDLSNNSFSGGLPMAMCGSEAKLQQLYLGSNQLSGAVSDNLCSCRSLSLISLPDNNFTGNIPKCLGNLTALNHLYLSDNNFTGELPAELGSLPLVHINVHNNGLSGAIPITIFNISSVNMLELSFNRFTGQLPPTFGLSLPNLEQLYLGDNELSGPLPSSISNASSLLLMSMSSNSFAGSVPDFGNLRLLQRVYFGGNNLTGTSPNQELTFLTSLTKCRFLLAMEFSLNQLNGMLPASIGNFSSTFQVFRAFGCGIRGPIPTEIGNLTNLRDLYLDSNELTGSIPRSLGNLGQLIRVYLEYNKLDGNLPGHLCLLDRLGDIYVSNNMLRGPIPSCIGEMKSLRRLYLDSNRLESSIPSTLWNLDLVALNLSTNSLNGSLSAEIGKLKAITDLDLSWNQFTGEVPSSIDGAESLVVLSLAHNKFEGPIPASIGNLRGLESLDLSLNSFSGSIPKSLEGLSYLTYFNVSYNRLEGEIPAGGRFANFTAQSFLMNLGLCSAARVEQLRVPHCRERSKNAGSLLKYIIPPSILAIIFIFSIFWVMKRRKPDEAPEAEIPSLHSWRGSSRFELQRMTNGFCESNILGEGGFGVVYKGTLSSGLTVAVKVFNLHSEIVAKSFDTEIEVLSAIRHRNLIKIIDCCSSDDFKALVYEYMPNGSLEKWLYSHNCFLDLHQRLNVVIDVASALEYLHTGLESPIVHCDLKPSNVLLDEDMTARVSDFGIAKLFGEGEQMTQTRTLATVGYMAPEYGAQGIVSTSGDVYSFGVMLLEVCTRRRPTDDMFGEEMSLKRWVSLSLQENALTEVVDANLLAGEEKDLSAKEECLGSVVSLAMACLATSPLDRIKINDVVIMLENIRTVFVAKVKKAELFELHIDSK